MSISAAHRREVCQLYRAVLKQCRDWSVDPRVYRIEAEKIRQEFHSNKSETNSSRIHHLIERTKQQLIDRAHPDPYIPPTHPGGSKYQRNIPPHPSFQFVEYPSESHSLQSRVDSD